MDNSFSIEKFAAFLDGNLLPDEMEQISSEVNNDEMMRDILSASKQVDETIDSYNPEDLVLPDELSSYDFEFPSLSEESVPYIETGDYEVAACASPAVDDFGSIEEDNIPLEVTDTNEDQIIDNSNNSFTSDTNIISNENDGDSVSDLNDY